MNHINYCTYTRADGWTLTFRSSEYYWQLISIRSYCYLQVGNIIVARWSSALCYVSDCCYGNAYWL